jgi:hypothetical protein
LELTEVNADQDQATFVWEKNYSPNPRPTI